MSSSNFFSSHNARRPSKYSGVAGVTPPSPCTPSIKMATVAGEIASAPPPGRCTECAGNPADRLEPFFHFVLAGGGDARERAAVKGIRRRENFKPALVMAEFARELEQAFVGLRAAIGKKTFARADAPDDFRRQPALRFGEIQVGNVDRVFATAPPAPR